MEKYICNINGTLVATSGIVHGLIAAVEGKKSDGKNNILPARRFSQILHATENGVEYPVTAEIPGVSGNEIRGIIRRLIVEHSFDVLDISVSELFSNVPHGDTVAQAVWFMFNNGGLTPKGSKVTASSLSLYDEIASIPWLGLLGAVYYGHQFEGSASFGIMYPLVKENIYLFQDELHFSDSELASLPSFFSTLEKLDVARFTRRANARDNSAADQKFVTSDDDSADKIKDAMIYGAEYMPAGIQLVSLNRCVTHDPAVMTAFKAAMALFLTRHLFVGGKSAMGFGRVRVGHGFVFDMEQAIADYDKLLLENKDEIIRKIKLIPEGLKFELTEKKKESKPKKAEKEDA